MCCNFNDFAWKITWSKWGGGCDRRLVITCSCVSNMLARLYSTDLLSCTCHCCSPGRNGLTSPFLCAMSNYEALAQSICADFSSAFSQKLTIWIPAVQFWNGLLLLSITILQQTHSNANCIQHGRSWNFTTPPPNYAIPLCIVPVATIPCLCSCILQN